MSQLMFSRGRPERADLSCSDAFGLVWQSRYGNRAHVAGILRNDRKRGERIEIIERGRCWRVRNYTLRLS